jgi:hypothetical protein
VSLVHTLKQIAVRAGSRCFDLFHRVDSSGMERSRVSGVAGEDLYYLATRPSVVREVLRSLRGTDLSDRIFVDLGSGKGRVLLLAAEHPFREIHGVELSEQLHLAALSNVARGRFLKRRCKVIECLHMNALDYEFPVANLVVYLFNPFGADVCEQILSSLHASIEKFPRDVIVISVFSELASVFSRCTWLLLQKRTPRYGIYRNRFAQTGSRRHAGWGSAIPEAHL